MAIDIGVVGLWHLGCVIAASWARLGHRVYGVERDEKIVGDLNRGRPPLFEKDLAEWTEEFLKAKKISFSVDYQTLSSCDVVFLTYDTPVGDDDTSDTSVLTEAVQKMAPKLKNGALVIVSSQTPVGLCHELRRTLQGVNPTVELAYSPENLRLGQAIDCYLKPGRVIVGAKNPATSDRARALFSEITDNVISMGLESSEVVKHGINAFLATSVVFGNSISDICELSGADIEDVVRGLKSDERIGQRAYISGGTGFSGGTLGRDLKTLDRINETERGPARLFGEVYRINAERTGHLVDKVEKILGGVNGKKLGVLGLTYKPGTSTLRRSLALETVAALVERGASVKAFDPKADYNELLGAPAGSRQDWKLTLQGKSVTEAAQGADLLLLLTDWPEFRSINWSEIRSLMKTPRLFDTKRLDFFAPTITRPGFR